MSAQRDAEDRERAAESEAPEVPHARIDVGTFFDRPKPSPRAWITPALLGVGCLALAAVAAWGDAAFARCMGCSIYAFVAAQMFVLAWSRRASR